MKTILLFLQAILALILTILIVIQGKGTGLGRAFGSTQTSFTRRGLEKLVFRASFIIAAVFVLISIISVAI